MMFPGLGHTEAQPCPIAHEVVAHVDAPCNYINAVDICEPAEFIVFNVLCISSPLEGAIAMKAL